MSDDYYLASTADSISDTEGYATNAVINEGLTDTQVRVFCALFVLFALASLVIGGKTLHLITRYNYNNSNRPMCLSVSSLIVACLVMGIFVSLVKLLIHITPETFGPWCKAQQYFSDLATNAALLSLALIMWDMRAKMQYNANDAHWSGSDYRKHHIAVVWILSAILAARMPFLKAVSSAPGYAQITACIYRTDVSEKLITAELIASAAILLLIALIIGAAQFYVNNGGSSSDTLRMSIALLIVVVVTKVPLHAFLIMSYTSQRSDEDFGIILNALELVMFAQGWLMPVAVIGFIQELRLDLGSCCDHSRISQNRLTADDVQINREDDGGRTSMQSRGTKSLRSANSPMPIMHI